VSYYISTLTDPLPSGQKPIITSSLEDFMGFMTIIMDSRDDGYAVIGVVYGNAGLGKSVSILTAADSLLPQAHSGLPGALLIELHPGITEVKFLKHLLDILDERPRGRTRSDLLDQVVEATIGNDIRLFVFDEANWFTHKTFELLRYISGRTKCPVLLVGLKSILRVISPYEQLESRAVFRHEFQPLNEQEVLSTFFPGITLSHWSFDPNSADDIKMGRYIWKRVTPSLRRAYAAVYAANKIAALKNKPRVTLAHIQEAFERMTPAKKQRGKKDDDDETLDPRRGEQEERSEHRHQHKNRRRRQTDDT
jgi:hypothetical protein